MVAVSHPLCRSLARTPAALWGPCPLGGADSRSLSRPVQMSPPQGASPLGMPLGKRGCEVPWEHRTWLYGSDRPHHRELPRAARQGPVPVQGPGQQMSSCLVGGALASLMAMTWGTMDHGDSEVKGHMAKGKVVLTCLRLVCKDSWSGQKHPLQGRLPVL